MSQTEEFLTRWMAEEKIKRVLLNYCRGVDRRDFDLVRSTYHPDAIDNHGPYNGDIDGLIAWMSRRHEGVAQSMHLIANCMIEWKDAKTALVETYCVTYQKLRKGAGASTSDVGLTVGGDGQQTQVRCRYLDRLEERQGEWKIAHRTVTYESVLLEASPEQDPFSSTMSLATRGKDDPLYDLIGR